MCKKTVPSCLLSLALSFTQPFYFIYCAILAQRSYALMPLFHSVSYCNIGKLDISQTHHTERSRIILHLRFISYRPSSPPLAPSPSRPKEKHIHSVYYTHSASRWWCGFWCRKYLVKISLKNWNCVHCILQCISFAKI